MCSLQATPILIDIIRSCLVSSRMHVTSTIIVTSASVRRVPAAAAHQRHQRMRRRSRKYINFNAKAAEGKIDTVIGRDNEIRRAIVILSRHAKKNPVLIGDPGVGKSAIAEGIAHRMYSRDVPDMMTTMSPV